MWKKTVRKPVWGKLIQNTDVPLAREILKAVVLQQTRNDKGTDGESPAQQSTLPALQCPPQDADCGSVSHTGIMHGAGSCERCSPIMTPVEERIYSALSKV